MALCSPLLLSWIRKPGELDDNCKTYVRIIIDKIYRIGIFSRGVSQELI